MDRAFLYISSNSLFRKPGGFYFIIANNVLNDIRVLFNKADFVINEEY